MLFLKCEKKSFTLIEVLVVLLLISLIMSIIAPKGQKLLSSISKKISIKEKHILDLNKEYEKFLHEK